MGRDSCARATEEILSFGGPVILVRGRSVPWADRLTDTLWAEGCTVEPLLSRGEPTLDDLREGLEVLRRTGARCVVAVGGGAAIDLGKAIAGLGTSPGDPADYLETGGDPAARPETPLPFVAIPTTAGTGAEATRNAVIAVPERRQKISLRDARFIPDLAIVDPGLTDHTPRGVTLASGLDAITQLVESYLSCRANPVTDAICRDTIPGAIAALCRLMRTEDPAARDTMARAAYLSGLALANSGLGIVHGLASVIGGRGGAHGAICGRLLAPALRVNRRAVAAAGLGRDRFDDVDRWLSRGLGWPGPDGVSALTAFVADNALPGLAALNCPEVAYDEIAADALNASSTRANPVPLSHADVVEILRTSD
ncbi:MAG: iron-containing alcohol dehydrogenase [Pseudooceanicola sp.]